MTSRSCGALQRRLRGEFARASAEYAVEGWKGVDDVGERLQWDAQLDREHELADDLARTRTDQHRAYQHAARTVANQFECPLVEVMDRAPRRLARIGAGDDDIEASGACGSLRQPDGRDFQIGR